MSIGHTRDKSISRVYRTDLKPLTLSKNLVLFTQHKSKQKTGYAGITKP